MAYPLDDAVNGWAAANAQDPEPVFAFAISKGRLPNDTNEFRGWVTSTLANGAFVGVTDSMLIYAYIIANRGLPPNSAAFTTWLAANGYWANGQVTGLEPQVGQGYDQAAGITSIPTTGTTVVTAPPPSPFDGIISSVEANPILWGGGALVSVFLLSQLLKGGRR